jgi:hypothetical protein
VAASSEGGFRGRWSLSGYRGKKAVGHKVAIDIVGCRPASLRIQLGNIYK